MFRGPPLPLSPAVRLSELLSLSPPPEQLGAWIRGRVSQLHIRRLPPWSCATVVASADLGFLLGRCTRIAVREEKHTVVVSAEALIQWRALQVVTGTPYLPGPERLKAMFPGSVASEKRLLIPIGLHSPEEVLARCVAEGVNVAGSRIVYRGSW